MHLITRFSQRFRRDLTAERCGLMSFQKKPAPLMMFHSPAAGAATDAAGGLDLQGDAAARPAVATGACRHQVPDGMVAT
jgi:hypothetical protein